MLTKTDLNDNKTQILLNFVIFALPVIILINFFFSYITNLQVEIINEKYASKQRELISSTEFQIRNVFLNAYDDLNLVLNANEFTDYVNNPDAETLLEARKMFTRVMKNKRQFTQLRYIDNSGMEIIRVNADGERITIVDENSLQNKSDRYYHEDSLLINNLELYISDFDLNIEEDEYVKPYEPVVRFSIPVFRNDIRSGYLIANYDGLGFLNILSEYENTRSSNIELGILDKNHLIGLNPSDDQAELIESFLPESDKLYNVVELYNETENEISGYFYLDSKNYYYKKLEGPKAPDLIFDPSGGNWVLISNYDTENVLQEEGGFILTNSIGLRIIIMSIIAIIIFVIVTLSTLRKKDDLMLLASGYISEYTNDGIVITDQQGKVIYCNKVFESTFGYSLSSIKGKNPETFLKGRTKMKLNEPGDEYDVWEGNLWDVTANNTYILKYLRVKAVHASRKKVAFYIGIYSEPKLSLLGETDNSLVGNHFTGSAMDFLTPALNDKFDMIEKKAVIAIKINEFSLMKSYVTDAEDNEIINTISNSFHDITLTGGMVIIPASGIVLVMAPIQSESSLQLLIEKINLSLASIKFSVNTNFPIDYIFGVAVSPAHGKAGSELINNAFIALEALIRMKKSKYLIYNQDIYELVKKDKIIRDEVENAFRNNEFSVVYQLLQDARSREILGVEVLSRWNSPVIGNVSPDSFIPIMEESGQIINLGKYIMELVTRDFSKSADLLPKDFRISINLSSQEFNNSEIISELLKIVDESGLPRTLFCFEITETTIVENIKYTNMVTEQLHSQNIIVAIDDFGTGYSPLSYLKELESDKIKIDRMFIKDYPASDDGTVLKSIINMIKNVSKTIIVEGVETIEQLEFIKENGCEEFQGFLFHKPMKIDQFMEIIKR